MQTVSRTTYCLRRDFLVRICSEFNKINNYSTLNANDVEFHSKLASDWWDPNGPVGPLHSLNRIRVPFIRDGLSATGRTSKDNINTSKSLENTKILEIGCGAGILTEQLARIHADVVAIDPSTELITTARNHLLSYPSNDELTKRIDYRTETIEEHNEKTDTKYDAVVVSEVLEHVADKEAFLKACTEPLSPGGSIFITTFNKTTLSWVGGIVFAEYLLNIIPRGTHEWNIFIPPLETQRILEGYGCSTVLCNGFLFEFWRKRWVWTKHEMRFAFF